jgi:peptidoglycan/xylan/chitin deacetylase (PgdA/CDA1 family)
LHGVLPGDEARLFNATGKFISPGKLASFVGRLRRTFTIVGMEAAASALAAGMKVDDALVITFDDGYANAYTHAMPVLRDLGVPFSVFVTTGYVDTTEVLWNDLLEFAVFSSQASLLPAGILGQDAALGSYAERCRVVMKLKRVLKRLPLDEASAKVRSLCGDLGVATEDPELENVRFLTSEQIREMSDQGVEFGGHTVTHPILSRETRDRVRTEVRDCKARLESITGKPVTCFAYPNGMRDDFNGMVKDEVRDVGYTAAFTAISGLNRKKPDLFEIKRLPVDCRWSYEELDARLSGILEAIRGHQ